MRLGVPVLIIHILKVLHMIISMRIGSMENKQLHSPGSLVQIKLDTKGKYLVLSTVLAASVIMHMMTDLQMKDLVQEFLTFLFLVVVNNSNLMCSLPIPIKILRLAVHPIKGALVPVRVKMCGTKQEMHLWKLMSMPREMEMDFVLHRYQTIGIFCFYKNKKNTLLASCF